MKTKLLSTAILFFLCSLTLQGQSSALDIIYGKQLFKQTGHNNNRHQKQLGNRMGLNYSLKVGQSNWIKAGIHYYELKEKSAVIGPFVNAVNQDPITGQLIFDTITSFQDFHTTQSIEIPINFRTEFGDKKLKPFIEGGLSVNILLDQKMKTIVDELSYTHSRKHLYDNKTSCMLSVSAGLNYNLSKRFVVLFQPFYKLNIVNRASLANRAFIINYGIQTGIRLLI